MRSLAVYTHWLNFLELVVDGPTIFCMNVLRVITQDWKLDRMIFYGDSLFLDQTEGDPVDDRFGPGRTAWNVEIDRNNLLQGTDDAIGVIPGTSATGAGPDSEDEFWLGDSLVRAPQLVLVI